MKKQFNKRDIAVLKQFVQNEIPAYIKFECFGKWDLMECYEELFNYITDILEGKKIDLNKNSYGTGREIIFEPEYKEVLLSLAKNDDADLKIYCYFSLTCLMILEKCKS